MTEDIKNKDGQIRVPVASKHAPDGLFALLKSIRKFHKNESKREFRENFNTYFSVNYALLQKEFGSLKKHETKSEKPTHEQQIRPMLDYTDKITTTQTPNILELMVFAKILEIPVGLLLLFSRFISIEYDSNEKKDGLKLNNLLLEITRLQSVFSELEKQVKLSDASSEETFYKKLHNEKYLGNYHLLKTLAEIYNKTSFKNE